MSQVNVKGLDSIAMNYASRVTELRETLNSNLKGLVDDWVKTSANTFAFKGQKAGFEAITHVTPLARLKGGTRGTQRASITLKLEPTDLTDFVVEQQRISVMETYNQASIRRGKYREKSMGKITMETNFYTRAKLLKQGATKLVVIKDKKGTLSSARGLKGFMYSPTNRVTAKETTPLGVYVRLQAATWRNGKRLPIYKLNAPPLAIIMLSPRILNRIKFYKRLDSIFEKA